MDAILSCDLASLPPEFFMSIFMLQHATHPSRTFHNCLTVANITIMTHLSCFTPVQQHTPCRPSCFTVDSYAQACYDAKHHAADDVTGKTRGKTPLVTAMEQYVQCVDEIWQRIKHCTPLLDRECRSAKVRVVKTIRLDLDLVDKVVERQPNIKVIHLVRDPRAMLHSRRHWVKPSTSEMTSLCARMVSDVAAWDRVTLSSSRSGTYLRVRYEDLATEPLKTALDICKHVNIDISSFSSKHLNSWLTNHTRADSDNDHLGTVRQNSAAHVDSWKVANYISNHYWLDASERCKNMTRTLSYLP